MGGQQAIHPADGRRSPSPYSPGVRAGDFIFVSGCVPVDAAGAVIGDDIAEQTAAVLENVRRVLRAGGADLPDVVRTTVYLVDIGEFDAMNDAYRRAFTDILPARTTIEVSRLANRAYRVEIDAIAIAPG